MVHICAACDDKYSKYLGVLITSILRQTDQPLSFYVLCSGLSPKSQEKIKLLREIRDFELCFIEVNPHFFDGFNYNFYSVEVWYRLLIGKMLPPEVKRVLYLDCDMVVVGDIGEVYHSNLRGKVVGAYHDVLVYPALADSTDMAIGSPYFNAGMLLIDLWQWRDLQIENKLFEIANSKKGNFLFNDQDVLNICFSQNDKCLALPKNYNFVLPFKHIRSPFKLWQAKQESIREFRQYRKEHAPVILHFIDKPWSRNACFVAWTFRKFYYEALVATPWHFPSHGAYRRYVVWQACVFPWFFLYKNLYDGLYFLYVRSLKKLKR